MPAVAFDNLTLGYDRHPAVHHLTGEVREGSLVAVVGPNGAGKSTLLKGIVGEVPPLEGSIRLAPDLRQRLAYLPQSAEIDRSFPITVPDFAALGLWRRCGPFGGIGRGERRMVSRALHAVGLDGFERRTIGTLSGGQLQRLLFARVILQDAPLILLDEPFAAIDAATCADLSAMIAGWHGEGRTVLAVMHDLPLVHSLFPEALLLAREPIAWGATGEALAPANLEQARRMVEAFDVAAHVCAKAA